jgi:hypothetical protein
MCSNAFGGCVVSLGGICTQVAFSALCARFYDDVCTVDLATGKCSAQQSLNFLFSFLGFPFAPRKHERLRGANAFLGVVTDFASVSLGYVFLKLKESRRRKLISELSDVLASKKLSPAHAARLRGKLYFTTTSAFFGVGRPALRSFTERQYSKRSTHALTPGLTHAIEFFLILVQKRSPAARVPFEASDPKADICVVRCDVGGGGRAEGGGCDGGG